MAWRLRTVSWGRLQINGFLGPPGVIGIFQTDRPMDGSKDVGTGVRLAEVTSEIGCLCLHPYLGIVVRRDEDDRGSIFDRREPLAQIESGHSFELDVEQKTIKLRPLRVRKKSFSRGIRDRLKVSGSQQSGHRAAKALVIINDCNIDVSGATHRIQYR